MGSSEKLSKNTKKVGIGVRSRVFFVIVVSLSCIPNVFMGFLPPLGICYIPT